MIRVLCVGLPAARLDEFRVRGVAFLPLPGSTAGGPHAPLLRWMRRAWFWRLAERYALDAEVMLLYSPPARRCRRIERRRALSGLAAPLIARSKVDMEAALRSWPAEASGSVHV